MKQPTRFALSATGFFLAVLMAAGTAGQALGPVALTGARVIDGSGRAPIEVGTILIDGGLIKAIGPSSSVPVPAGTTRVDVSGKTIIPGLINAHGHLNNGDEKLPPAQQLTTQLRLFADYGVTTVQSLGDDGVESVKVRDAQTDTGLNRARLFVSGQSLGGALRGRTPDEVRTVVDDRVAKKVNIIKAHVEGAPGSATKLTPDLYRAIIDQAHKQGLRVAAHMFYLEDAKGLLDAGVDLLAHSVRDRNVDAAFIAEMKRRNVAYIPTLTRDLSVFVYETTPAFFNEPFFLRRVDAYRGQMERLKDPRLQEKTRASKDAQAAKQALEQALRNLKLLSDAGVPIAMGTDTGVQLGRWQGYFEHTELELMVKAGMTPMQTLVAATGGAAKALRLPRLGTLEAGNLADLIVLNDNPLTDVRNTQKIDSVWIGGRRLMSQAGSN
jgi:imidazolonepropionase-like amidohydrolase